MIFGLTIFEFVMCLVGAAIFLYLLPYIIALIFIIGGILISLIGLVIEGIGRLLGGRD